MRKSVLVSLLLLPAVFGQVAGTGSTSVTVTVSPAQTPAPDQTTFAVTIESSVTTTLDDVMSALQGTGLTLANFSSVSSTLRYSGGNNRPSTVLDWSFQVPVPLTGIKTEVAALNAIQANFSQKRIPLSVSYSLQGPQVSTQAQVQSCNLSDLFAMARTKAQQIAGAANLIAGKPVALSASVSTAIGPSAPAPYVVPACQLAATFALAAAAPGTLTVSASRNVNVPPDLMVVGISVQTTGTGGLDDVLAALSGTGVTATNLVYSSSFGYQPGIQWQFSITAPLAQIKDTLSALQSAQNAVPANNAGPVTSITFSIQGTQVSPKSAATQDCTNAALVNDAQAYARQVAAAASVPLGNIVAISDGSAVGIPTLAYRAAWFDTLTGGAALGSFLLGSPSGPSCSLTVQFSIGQ